MQKIFKLLPGLTICIVIAILAELIHNLPFPPFTITGTAPHPIEPIIIAIILGIIFSNIINLPALKEGINFSTKKVLPAAIILLGAQLNLFEVLKISLHALLISTVCVVVIFIITLWLCKITHVGKRLGILIGIGTAICGSTAIVVSAPVIKARETEIAIAITTITLFGILAIFIYPLIGHVLKMSQWAFGVWAGIAIQAIPQVIAAGFAYGPQAGNISTVVKLVRVLLLAPMILALSFWQARQKDLTHALEQVEKVKWTNYVPPFILGFILFVVLGTLGVFHDFTIANQQIETLNLFKIISGFLLTIAMAAIGLNTDLRSFLKTGTKPMLIGFLSAILLAIFSLALIRI